MEASNKQPRSNAVTVLGAGVSGLTTAVTLQEAGYQVEIIAREFSPGTTSDLAGALWYPSHAWPLELTRRWGLETLQELLRLHEAFGPNETGIRLVRGTRHFYRQMGFPWWRNHVTQFRILTESERPERARTSYEYTVPLLDMPHYLGRYLLNRFQTAGGVCKQRSLTTWEEALALSADLVVNCTGLGSFELLGDKELFPVRGQVLKSESVAARHFTLSADHPEGSIYVIPRGKGVLVGGGSRSGVWDLSIDEEYSKKILRVGAELSPAITAATDWTARVGLRPGRKTVRCERGIEVSGKKIFHNYGHTGAGVTLSWGCSREILRLIANRSDFESVPP